MCDLYFGYRCSVDASISMTKSTTNELGSLSSRTSPPKAPASVPPPAIPNLTK
jgi:hypothetical protein